LSVTLSNARRIRFSALTFALLNFHNEFVLLQEYGIFAPGREFTGIFHRGCFIRLGEFAPDALKL
jgi:hypothetical protein